MCVVVKAAGTLGLVGMGCHHLNNPRMLVPWLLLLSVVLAAATREALIQHAVQQLLGVPGERTRATDPTATPPPLPHYMLQLYERYQNGDLRGIHSSNTVRSILASRGKLLGDDVLLFNLSGIHGNEDIVKAELHFFRRRRRRNVGVSSLLPRLRVQLLAVQNKERLQRLTSLEVKAPSRGWQASDVTAGVTGLRKRSNFANAVLAARFEASGRRGHFRSLPAKKLMVPGSTPFLIVFSNDSVSSLLDDDVAEIDEEDDDVDALLRDGHNATALFLLARRARRHSRNMAPAQNEAFGQNGYQKSDESVETVSSNNQTVRRLPRRSLDDNTISEGDFNVDNELPEKFHPASSNRVPLTGPSMLLPRPRQPKHSRTDSSNGLLPRPPRRRTHSQKRPPKHTPLPKIWREKFENEASAAPPEDEFQSVPCRRRKLVVEFSEIGWGEWIISPKAFEAHYCAGSCPFPLNKSVRPSNHATIQSLVHAIGVRAHVPAPCCVPDALSSLTLLYFDEDRNVVLKNYPAMTVESCACR